MLLATIISGMVFLHVLMGMQTRLAILKSNPVVHNWLAIPLSQDVTREDDAMYIGMHGAGRDRDGCVFGVGYGRHAASLLYSNSLLFMLYKYRLLSLSYAKYLTFGCVFARMRTDNKPP